MRAFNLQWLQSQNIIVGLTSYWWILEGSHVPSVKDIVRLLGMEATDLTDRVKGSPPIYYLPFNWKLKIYFIENWFNWNYWYAQTIYNTHYLYIGLLEKTLTHTDHPFWTRSWLVLLSTQHNTLFLSILG